MRITGAPHRVTEARLAIEERGGVIVFVTLVLPYRRDCWRINLKETFHPQMAIELGKPSQRWFKPRPVPRRDDIPANRAGG